MQVGYFVARETISPGSVWVLIALTFVLIQVDAFFEFLKLCCVVQLFQPVEPRIKTSSWTSGLLPL
jgi:hypothetical protein